mmetsp:Transcript_43174/g.92104  ORF Transcript_43174/g.92104 Transcript_43174/m.92104 type:complete len:80 (+) Transcript_43174:111-350(+)
MGFSAAKWIYEVLKEQGCCRRRNVVDSAELATAAGSETKGVVGDADAGIQSQCSTAASTPLASPRSAEADVPGVKSKDA